MNGMSRIVRQRSCVDDKVRVAMTAGTEQPKPTSKGAMLRPVRPNLRKKQSLTKAMRDM